MAAEDSAPVGVAIDEKGDPDRPLRAEEKAVGDDDTPQRIVAERPRDDRPGLSRSLAHPGHLRAGSRFLQGVDLRLTR